MIGFGEAVKRFFHRAFDFKGRACRAEFWWVQIFFFLLMVILGILIALLVPAADGGSEGLFDGLLMLVGLVTLALIVPNIALFVRRLHDINISGWLSLILVLQAIPYIGLLFTVAVFVIGGIPGTKGTNRFGMDPFTA